MKIIYGICGEGQGHAVRSKPVIKHLMQKHSVDVLCGGKAFDYLSQHFGARHIEYFAIDYKDNTVSNIGTFFLSIKKSPRLLASFLKTIRFFRNNKPDLVISDFEPMTAYCSYLFRTPLISIDNIHVSSHANLIFSNRHIADYLRLRSVIKMIMPIARHFLITTFFYPKTVKKNASLFPPILRDELQALKPKKGEHILVYQTSRSYGRLPPLLRTINEKFIIYGFDVEKKEGNLTFKKRSDKTFFRDLANCKAIITNGGFTLISEALYLRKPILSVPVNHQFEQVINAIYLQRADYGKFHYRLNKQKIEEFIERLPFYEQNLKKYQREDNAKLFKKLDSLIGSIKKKKMG